MNNSNMMLPTQIITMPRYLLVINWKSRLMINHKRCPPYRLNKLRMPLSKRSKSGKWQSMIPTSALMRKMWWNNLTSSLRESHYIITARLCFLNTRVSTTLWTKSPILCLIALIHLERSLSSALILPIIARQRLYQMKKRGIKPSIKWLESKTLSTINKNLKYKTLCLKCKIVFPYMQHSKKSTNKSLQFILLTNLMEALILLTESNRWTHSKALR